MRCYVDQFTTEIKQSSEEDKSESLNSFEHAVHNEDNSLLQKFLDPQRDEFET